MTGQLVGGDEVVFVGVSDTVEWTVDNVLPTAHRTLSSEPLTTLEDFGAPNRINGAQGGDRADL